MSGPLQWVLGMSLAGSVLILLLMLLRPLVRERVSKQWQYYIWLLVIVRLLAPVGALVPPAEDGGPEGGTVLVQSLPKARAEETAGVLWGETALAEAGLESDAFRALWTAVQGNLWVLWLAGALALLVRKVTAYQSFVRCLRAGWTPVDDPALLDRAAEIGAEIGVKRPVELYVNPLAASPMLLGGRKPRVVLPAAEMAEEDLRFVLLHELVHFRRRDVWYKWLVQITVCVHWFNPLVHWMGREVERLGELSCDEAVLRRLDGAERRAYGGALLRTVSAGGGYQADFPSPALGAEGKQLKERLETIMRFKKRGRRSAVLAAVLATVLGMTAVAAGGYAGLPTVTVAAGDPLPTEAKEAAYRYTMESFYEAPYLFGIGWNSQKEEGTAVSVTLPEGGRLTVYYSDAVKGITKDKKAMEALTKVLVRLREETQDTDFPMTRPLVYQWENTGGGSGEEMAEKYYEAGNLPFFRAVFAGLSKPEQASWMAKIYEDGQYAFLSAAVGGLEADGDLVKAYAEKAYANGAAGQFSILADRMSEETLESWLERTKKDQQFAFQSILLGKLDRDRDLDELEAWLDAMQAAQYKAVGVTVDGTDYYYQGKLVNVFLDQSGNSGVYTLSTNPAGAVNIRIVRNAEGAVAGAVELTREEIAELFGEDFESVKWDVLREKDDEWDWDWDDEKWDEEEKLRTEEYAAHGVVMKDDKHYYYQGELVGIFLDHRTDSSFYNLSVNPEGTVNIKILRDEAGRITGAAKLTQEEIRELFGEE